MHECLCLWTRVEAKTWLRYIVCIFLGSKSGTKDAARSLLCFSLVISSCLYHMTRHIATAGNIHSKKKPSAHVLRMPNTRYVSHSDKVCISDWHFNSTTLSTVPSAHPNFLFFFLLWNIYEWTHTHTHTHFCDVLFLLIWAIHQNNMRADLTWITCAECSCLW